MCLKMGYEPKSYRDLALIQCGAQKMMAEKRDGTSMRRSDGALPMRREDNPQSEIRN